MKKLDILDIIGRIMGQKVQTFNQEGTKNEAPGTGRSYRIIRYFTHSNRCHTERPSRLSHNPGGEGPDAGCVGTQTTGLQTAGVQTTSSWTKLTAPTEVAPAGTQSATVYLTVQKASGIPEDFSVSFDGIDFRISPRIFSDDFESGDASLWSDSVPPLGER